MKILKIFGIVVGIHIAALVLIFANPGCSSTTKPPPSPEDTAMHTEAPPTITVPVANPAPAPEPTGYGPLTPPTFDPNAPAAYAATSNPGTGIRFMPTRPNTPAASAVTAAPVENVTPATTYKVKSGDSLWELGKRFHIDYRQIAAANNINSGAVLREGQTLLIPKSAVTSASSKSVAGSTPAPAPSTPAPAPAAPRPASGDEVTYTVLPGETLGAIARRFDVSAKELALHNNVTDPAKLRAGTTLSIPSREWRRPGGKSTTPATPTPAPQQPKEIPNLLEEPAPTPPPASSNVPVIKIDEPPQS